MPPVMHRPGTRPNSHDQVHQAGVEIYPQHFALSLVTKAGQCCGIITIHNQTLQLFLGAAIILCSGGIGQLYGQTTNPSIATGDGIMLAYHAGAALRDLEFVQFHPTALALPDTPAYLISESMRGEGALLLNYAGERFMPKYHAAAELAPRDVVARAIFTEIQQQADLGHVFLDLSEIQPELIRSRFPNIYQTCLQYGLDITTQPIPVAPAAHYMMGGITTNLWGQTSIPGLYAAGEVANTGIHGANRLASNSLLEGLVFGGRDSRYLKNQTLLTPKITDELQTFYPQLSQALDPVSDLALLHRLTGRYLGIIRDEAGLKTALAELSPRNSTGQHPWELTPAYFELQNMYNLAALIAQAALLRTESRGGHFRSDFPVPVPSWRQHIQFWQSQIEVVA